MSSEKKLQSFCPSKLHRFHLFDRAGRTVDAARAKQVEGGEQGKTAWTALDEGENYRVSALRADTCLLLKLLT